MGVPAGYIAAIDLEPLLIDKDTGAPLTNGTIWFYQDSARNVPKNVYEIQNLGGAPPVYNFVPLPNPVNLAAFGTQQDNAGNNVAIYYYPYDAAGNIQLYFVQVYNSNGVLQLTREAWPPGVTQQNGPANQDGNLANQLSNPQFAVVNFLPNNPLVVTVTGAGVFTYTGIIPDWNINVTATAATTVTITRTAIAGSAALPNNPPYTLSVLPGANITAVSLSQRLFNDPNIWAPSNAAAANGWLASSILLATGTTVTMQYQPNGLAPFNILTANNTSGGFATFNNTIQLPPATNPATGDTGYVDIILNFPVVGTSTFSNVQVVPVSTNLVNIAYDQTPVNRQIDQLFNYYNPLLQYKPIPSFCVGWDFDLNPTQFLGPAIAASAAGANTSSYTWDQTIVFQSANNGAAISRGHDGGFVVTATNTTQFALIQYFPEPIARKILNNDIAAQISALTMGAYSLTGKITLWYTTNVNLPSTVGANQSLVTGLDATGFPAVVAGWAQVPRGNLGDAAFTVSGNPIGIFYPSVPFTGWNVFPSNNAASSTATWMAIVVGFSSLVATRAISIDSISLCPGKIATIPAPQTLDEVLLNCQYYWQMTFPVGTVPQQALGDFSGDHLYLTDAAGATGQYSSSIYFVPAMYDAPTITFYNPHNMNGQVYDYFVAGDCSATTVRYATSRSFAFYCTGNPAGTFPNNIGVHWTADSRLGQ